jgi:hypothetical protein
MNAFPHLTNMRSHLSDQFNALRARAVRGSLWAKLIGKSTTLEVFPEEAPEKSPNRTFTGAIEVPLEQIVGTLNRQSDFDKQFRPLKAYLRDRWVNVYLAHQNEGWPPILLHRVGGRYYVEDGHHRVSVARALQLSFIQATVWEYPARAQKTRSCAEAECPRRTCSTVCAGVAG